MIFVEYFIFSSLVNFLIVCISFWVLKYIFGNTNNKSGPQIEVRKSASLWNELQVYFVVLKLSTNTSKIPFLEKLCSELNRIFPFQSPKIFNFFTTTLVVTDDVDSIKNVLLNKKLTAQIPDSVADILANGKRKGFLHNNGPVWKELRTYTIRKLSELGFGKSDKLSLTLADLLPDLLEHFESVKVMSGNKIPIKNIFVLQGINVIWGTVGGQKFSHGDKQVVELYHNMDTIVNLPMVKGFLLSVLPNSRFLHYLLGYKPFYDSISNSAQYFNDFVERKIQSSIDEREPNDFVGHFLVEIEKYKNDDKLKHIYCKEQLAAVLMDLFIAGIETTNSYLELAVMFMIMNPEVQRKVQEEIDLNIGDQQPSYCEHSKKTPYICATLMEVHRMGSVIPTLGRFATCDINNKGESIEKGTQILNIMSAIRMNETFWGDPHSFRPERFLNEDNSLATELFSHVIPFGAGGRMCPGEIVATASSYTFIVGLLQKYTVQKASEDQMLGMEKRFAATTSTLPFQLSIFKRD